MSSHTKYPDGTVWQYYQHGDHWYDMVAIGGKIHSVRRDGTHTEENKMQGAEMYYDTNSDYRRIDVAQVVATLPPGNPLRKYQVGQPNVKAGDVVVEYDFALKREDYGTVQSVIYNHLDYKKSLVRIGWMGHEVLVCAGDLLSIPKRSELMFGPAAKVVLKLNTQEATP